ncbi:unnamed protein product [Periconia digitata]|uniref:Uncharacterized protein n=1 Tax=Periconia digitata TaxID=1303443 RepID=A0A9W4XZE4_9PLEO|nr:unnamed protein product [Periconia digitata]
MQPEKSAPERIITVQSIKRIGADLKVRCKVGCPSVSGYVDYEDMPWHTFRGMDGAQPAVELIQKDLYGDLEGLWKELTTGEEILLEGNEASLRNRIVFPIRNAPKAVLLKFYYVAQWDKEFRLKVGMTQWKRGVFPERGVEEYIEKFITLAEFMKTEFEHTESHNEIVEIMTKEVQDFRNHGLFFQIFGWVTGYFPGFFVKSR